MRTNKRRNLNSGQWATIAVEAEDIMAAIKADAEQRQKTGKADLTKKFQKVRAIR